MRTFATVLILASAACSNPTTGPAAQEGASMARDDPAMIEKRKRALDRKSLMPAPGAVALTGAVGEVPDALVERVRADVNARTDASEIVLLRAESVTWPSGAMGCPEPGMTYTQALVPGYHVEFDVDGKRFDYRLNEGGRFKLCETQSPLSR